ncbi:MAG: GNAT family N-acetyltransferase [Rhodanobacter sp.]
MDIVSLHEHMEFVPELAQLHYEEWGHLRPKESLVERTARLTQMCTATDMPSVVVGLESGRLIGSAMLIPKDGLLVENHLTPWLAGVYVKSEDRSRGIAVALIRHIEELARQAGHRAIYLCTDTYAAYYERHGYGTVETQEFLDEPVYIMAKLLA